MYQCGPLPRQKIPLDGPGPRGDPECYYTSRVNPSSARYVRFVKKLRAEEEEQRKGQANAKKELNDKKTNQFFIRCDRRSLINNVARRVDLCLRSYEDDLNDKRAKVLALLNAEEEQNIRKFVEQAQSGADLLQKEKEDRLAYLIAKRRKEHEEKYKNTPLAKCTHVSSCLVHARCKEAHSINQLQMRENQARKMQEREVDKMWHEINMKECEAMSARMEIDAIERKRRDYEWKLFNDSETERRQKERERLKELKKKEEEYFMALWDEENRLDREDKQRRKDQAMETGKDFEKCMKENVATKQRLKEEEKAVEEIWDANAVAGANVENKKAEIRQKRAKEQTICNRKMIEIRDNIASRDTENDYKFEEELQKHQAIMDQKRCDLYLKNLKNNKESRVVMLQQIKDREKQREEDAKWEREQTEYYADIYKQAVQLDKNYERARLEERKQYQRDLLAQIEYNKIVKEREKREEVEQYEKALKADDSYLNTMMEMMGRPFHSDEIHPFQQVMYEKRYPKFVKCPCKKPDWCKN